MNLTFVKATEEHATAIWTMRSLVAAFLELQHGSGDWSSEPSESGVLNAVRTSYVVAAFEDTKLVGTLRLLTKKPWAIDASFFTPVERPLFVVDMAVAPGSQRKGVGRALLKEANRIAVEWPANALWLDAYDALAGAGGFYASCGFSEVGRKEYKGTPLVYFEKPVVGAP
ncbi:MAG: GNAT family N-acetyltransferase [Phycisphaerae bacterium]|nr:GNAT family N-acetyltransferase [Gemmatimonadaceae bacterium]